MKEKRRMLKEAFAKNPRLSPNEQRELARVWSMKKLKNGSKIREPMQKENELFRLCFNLQISFKGFNHGLTTEAQVAIMKTIQEVSYIQYSVNAGKASKNIVLQCS